MPIVMAGARRPRSGQACDDRLRSLHVAAQTEFVRVEETQ